MTGYSYSTPIWASMPAAMLLSTGLAEEACTRTSTSPGPGFGVGRSSRAAGGAPASLSVMAFIFCVPLGFEASVGGGSECLLDVVADPQFRAVAMGEGGRQAWPVDDVGDVRARAVTPSPSSSARVLAGVMEEEQFV